MRASPSPRIARALTVGILVVAGCGGAATGSGSSSPAASVATAANPSATPAASPGPTSSPVAGASPIGPPPSPSPRAQPSVEPMPEPTDDPGTAGPGCGTGPAGLFAHRDEIPDTLHFGGATPQFTTAVIAMRNGTYVAEDAIPAGIGLAPDELAVRVDPGTHIILRGDGMTIRSVSASSVPWSTVIFVGGLGSSAATPEGLVWRLRSDGSISVRAPTKPGDYMVELIPRWQTACLQGDGAAYGRIKVN